MSQIIAAEKSQNKRKREWIKSGFRVVFKKPRFMNRWLRYDAWSALMQKNYDMVEVMKLNGNRMNKALHADMNLCIDMDKLGHENETGIFRNCTKEFIDGKKQNRLSGATMPSIRAQR